MAAAFLRVLLVCVGGTEEGLAALQAKEYERAREELLAPASAGDPEAQYRLAELLLQGLGGAINEKRAVWLLEKAAAAGHALACGRLGDLLWRGRGVPRNRTRALEFLRKGADAGSPPAMYRLSKLAALGFEVGISSEEASRLLERAAEAGHPGAQAKLGLAYLHGSRGFPKDAQRAAIWFERSGEQGHPVGVSETAARLKDARDLRQREWAERGVRLGLPAALFTAVAVYRGAGRDLEAYTVALVAVEPENRYWPPIEELGPAASAADRKAARELRTYIEEEDRELTALFRDQLEQLRPKLDRSEIDQAVKDAKRIVAEIKSNTARDLDW